jgi:hypothetical protein
MSQETSCSRNPAFILWLAIAALVAAMPAHAVCVDWSTGAPPAPYVNFNGPFFHDLQGGSMRDGFLLKNTITWSGLYYSQDTYLFDVRVPDQPREVRHWVGAGGPFENPTEFVLEEVDGDHCVVGVFGWGGYGRRLVTSTPSGSTDVLLTSGRGMVSLWGDRGFQLVENNISEEFGVACLDVSMPAAPIVLGVMDGLFTELEALSASLVMVRAQDGLLYIVDFTQPAAPVLRGNIAAGFSRWLGFASGRVVLATGLTTIGIDVTDPDAPYAAWALFGNASAIASEGSLLAVSFPGTGTTLALYDAGGDSVIPLSGMFGVEPSTNTCLVIGDGVLYSGGICAYDITDPTEPQWLGTAGVTSNTGIEGNTFTYGDQWLLTQSGLLWSHCANVSDVPPAIAALHVAARPNPFNPATSLSFANAREGLVQVTVFDARGHRVRALVDEVRPAGPQSVAWDGRGDDGRMAAAGLYVARVTTEAGSATCKVMMAK